MKNTANLVVLAIVFIALNTTAALGFNIKLINKITLSQEKIMLQKAVSFCITEDEIFIIPDLKAGDVKIYENNGNLVTMLGRKGYGPGEFVKPTYCFYSKEEKKMGVLDHGLKKIFIYNRIGQTDFKRAREVFCLAAGSDIQLKNNKLLVSGYKSSPDGNSYDLYFIDLTNNLTNFLLPSYYKYGLKSSQEFKAQISRKTDISAIGINGWFDIHGDYAYFIWEGDLRIIKINIHSGKLGFFGQKTSHYQKPFASKRMIEGYRTRNSDLIYSEKAKMSFVRNIFASGKYVLLVYEGPNEQEKPENFRMQFYTLDGTFLEEISIPDKSNRRMCLDKERNILYSLSSEVDDDLSEKYFILKYKIIDK